MCAPTHLEAAALRRTVHGGATRRVGTGRNAARAARVPQVDTARALAVAGIGGGLDPRLRPGDVVVATEVRGPDGTHACASAPMLAGRLRRTGLSVYEGPVLTADHVVATESERARLAATGALCVDLESYWLVGEAKAPATAVVRVVADVATGPLYRPATAGHVATALRVLSTVGPAVECWGRAAGARQVLLAGPRSFCAGVVRAVEVVERALEQRGAPVYVRKQIVHNVHVVHDLQERGAVFVDELADVPAGGTVVFSAHGVSPQVRDEAARRGLSVVDATCPLVSKVHAEVRRFADAGDTVIFIGHAGHEESEGTMGERPDDTVLVEDAAGARTVAVADPDRVSYIVQTTLAADEVAEIVDILQARFPRLRQPPSEDICYATTNRQQALEDVARESDLALVIGSRNSSNSQRLVEKSQRLGTPAYLVDDAGDVDLAWLDGARTVAVTAGASAPTSLVDEVVAALRGLGPVEVVDRELTTEDVHFTLPKEVRQP